MSSTGAPAIEHPTIEVPDGPVSKGKLEMLAFMNELVVVQVHEDNSNYPEPLVQTWNDGRLQIFIRGQEVTCRRCFVEVLARAKPVQYANVEYVDAEGNRAVKWPKRTGLKYPFTIVRDDNPNGRAWLKKILAEGA